MTSSKYREHTDPIFEKLGLLKFQDLNKYLLCRFMFRWYHDKLPTIFYDVFTNVNDVHKYNTRQTKHLYIKKVKTNLGKTKFSYQAPLIWNKSLEAKINPDTSEPVYAKTIKHCIKVKIL